VSETGGDSIFAHRPPLFKYNVTVGLEASKHPELLPQIEHFI